MTLECDSCCTGGKVEVNPIQGFQFHASDDKYFGRMDNPQIASYVKGCAGDTIEFNIEVKEDRIINISFYTEGSKEIRACGSVIAKHMDGEYIQKGRELCADFVMWHLEDSGLPVDHWAILAVRSFYQALEQFFYKKYLEARFN